MPKALKTRRCLPLLIATALGLAATGALAQQRGGAGGARGGAAAGGTRSLSGAYAPSTELGTAIIATDAEARKLVITADEETHAHIMEIIRNLDKPKPQVLINVVFLQVTHGDDLDLGVEASYTHRLGGAPQNKVGTPATATALAVPAVNGDSVASSSFGLTDAASLLAGGGLYKLVGEDFSATLRALSVKGKTEILSRPSILARNNQQATILVGQSVPLVTGTSFNAISGQVNTFAYQDIGIILRVTPFISEQRNVEMIVQPEISSISDRTVSVQAGVNVPVIDKRSADTVVVTPDGTTVAIGGLIGNTKINQDRKVPLLGDIPLLGALFKRQIKTDTKTELLIFLTPHVIMNSSELAGMTSRETGRLKMAPKTFSEEELNRFLETVPEKKPEPVVVPEVKTPPSPRQGKR